MENIIGALSQVKMTARRSVCSCRRAVIECFFADWSVRKGATRYVVLTKSRAYKFPSFASWNLFLHGLLANMQEHSFYKLSDAMCPVIGYIRGGFLVVMPRAVPLTDEEYESFDVVGFLDRETFLIPAENKQSSFGKLHGRIVAVDYG